MKRISLMAFSCLFSVGLNAQVNSSNFAESISQEDLKKHLSVLASDAYEGRETGLEGQKKAANYIAEQFKSFDLEGPVNGSYLQEFPLVKKYWAERILLINQKQYTWLEDFYALPNNEKSKVYTNEIVFVGYGIQDSLYNDFEGIDVKNKLIVIMQGEPQNTKGVYGVSRTSEKSNWSSTYGYKLQKLAALQPAGILVIDTEIEDNIKRYGHYISTPEVKLVKEPKVEKEKMPAVLFISPAIADSLLKVNKLTLAKLKTKIDAKLKPKSVALSSTVGINLNRTESQITSENVLGFLPGTDLKEEVLVISAHYDHIGVIDSLVYNGADDDGSGTVAVIELAEAFALAAKQGAGPRRSILFLTVAGEEKGLLGSSYYTDINPVFPLANTVCDLNIDMIGRVDEAHKDSPDYVYIIGSDKLSTSLHQINEDANENYTKLNLDYTYNDPKDPNRFYYRSDHYNFAKNNIPVIFYFNGVHEDYHKHTDEISKINFEALQKRAQLVFHAAWDVANRDKRPEVDVKNAFPTK